MTVFVKLVQQQLGLQVSSSMGFLYSAEKAKVDVEDVIYFLLIRVLIVVSPRKIQRVTF